MNRLTKDTLLLLRNQAEQLLDASYADGDVTGFFPSTERHKLALLNAEISRRND